MGIFTNLVNEFNMGVMQKIFRTILFIFFLLIVFLGKSQEPVYRHFTQENGLPSSEVYHVMQDSKGYIWFATNNGVSRYNGTEFENFGLEHGLPDLTVFEIYEDYKVRIWFIPLSGKLSYFENDSIFIYKHNHLITDYDLITSGPIKYSFFINKDETVYLSIDKRGLLKITDAGEIEVTNINETESINKIVSVNDSVEFIIRGHIQSKYIKRYCEIEKLNKLIPYDGKYTDFPTGESKSIFINYRDGYVLSIFKYLLYINSENEIKYTRFPGMVVALNVDKDSNLFVGLHTAGTYIFKNTEDLNKPYSELFSGFTITAVLNDKEGGYWFTTLKEGVLFVKNLKSWSINLKNSKNKFQTLLAGDKGVYAAVKNSTDIIKVNNENKIELIEGENDDRKINKSCIAINNSVFFGSPYGLTEFCETKKETIYIPGGVLDIKNKNRNLLIGRSSGFAIVDKTNMNYIYNSSSINLGFHFNKRVNSICANGQIVYLGCPDGLWSFKDSIYSFLGDSNELLKNRILDIKTNPNNNVFYLATKGAGIIVIQPDSVWNITKVDGLSDNTVVDIEVNGNEVWAATINGLNKLEIFDKKYTIRKLNTKHGLSSNIINDIDIYDSTIYIATDEGLCYFKSNAIETNKTPPPTYIKSLKINSQDTLLLSKYELSYDENILKFSYRGLTYKSNGDINYKYRLLGASDRWEYTKNNEVLFNLLPPGKYTFQVEAANEDGIWSAEWAAVSFVINPPFWKTWWFILIELLVFGMIVFLIVRARFKAQAKKNKLNTDLIKIRQQALGSQMNPHFIFNSLNSIQNFILQNQRETSQQYLSDFAKLMRKVLMNSQQTTISLAEEIDALKLYVGLEQVRFSGRFETKFEIAKDADLENIFIPPLMLQPYVENSIWHGLMHKKEDGMLLIKVERFESEVLCIIEDNGVGRKKTFEMKKGRKGTYKSMGGGITEKRLNLFNLLNKTNMRVEYKDLESEVGEPQGTRVEFYLPIINTGN